MVALYEIIMLRFHQPNTIFLFKDFEEEKNC